MPNPVVRKLRAAEDFTAEDLATLERLCARAHRVEARRDIVTQGSPPSAVHFVLDGFAHRYKVLPGGGRQIVGLLVPGDFCDLCAAMLGEMDHSIAALTDCVLVDLPPGTVRTLIGGHPRITRALWWATLVDKAMLREWLTNLGRREAVVRLAHLLCELRLRLCAVGLADDGGYDLPLRQADLADALGLTPVHVNRSLRVLRGEGLIVLRGRAVIIPDAARLEAFGDFDPAYLHLERRFLADEHGALPERHRRSMVP